MSKAATLKDVLYALQFAGAQLCRWSNPGGKVQAWSLEPGGIKVPPHVADKAREMRDVVAGPQSQYGETRYIWQPAQ